MSTVALWLIRIGRRIPLPARAKAHLDRCLSVELFDSVFSENIVGLNAAQVLGLRAMPDTTSYTPRFLEALDEGAGAVPGDAVLADAIKPPILEAGDGLKRRRYTVH